MIPRRTSARLAAAALLIGSMGLTGCGSSSSSSKPAICSDVTSLTQSFDALKKVDIKQQGLTKLQDDLKQVQSDLKQVMSDAKSQYKTEVDAVDSAASTLGASLKAAVATPSAQTIDAVATAAKALSTSVTDLEKAVKSTC